MNIGVASGSHGTGPKISARWKLLSVCKHPPHVKHAGKELNKANYAV